MGLRAETKVRADKVHEQWLRAGRPPLSDFAAASGVGLSVLKKWCAAQGWQTDFRPPSSPPPAAAPALHAFGFEPPREAGTVRGRHVPEEVRYAVWARDEWICAYCGITCKRERPGNGLPGHNDPQYATCDHLVPHSAGGRDIPPNMVTACLGCNSRKGPKPLAEFLALLEAEGADLLAIEARLARVDTPTGPPAAPVETEPAEPAERVEWADVLAMARRDAGKFYSRLVMLVDGTIPASAGVVAKAVGLGLGLGGFVPPKPRAPEPEAPKISLADAPHETFDEQEEVLRRIWHGEE